MKSVEFYLESPQFDVIMVWMMSPVKDDIDNVIRASPFVTAAIGTLPTLPTNVSLSTKFFSPSAAERCRRSI